jgi:hypothetical protein
MNYKYCQAENWGKNFIKTEDSLKFFNKRITWKYLENT